jgi:hypothetical protein
MVSVLEDFTSYYNKPVIVLPFVLFQPAAPFSTLIDFLCSFLFEFDLHGLQNELVKMCELLEMSTLN